MEAEDAAEEADGDSTAVAEDADGAGIAVVTVEDTEADVAAGAEVAIIRTTRQKQKVRYCYTVCPRRILLEIHTSKEE